MPDMNGDWLGNLIYGPGFGELEHEALFFTLQLRENGDGFSGVARDVDGLGMHSDPAVVHGFVDDGHINFVKRYVTDVPADAHFPAVVAANEKGPEISFTGFWDSERREFSGDWVVLQSYLEYGTVFYETTGGTWRMRPHAD